MPRASNAKALARLAGLAALALLAALCVGSADASAAGPAQTQASAAIVQALAAPGQPALVEFGADYCPPCRAMAPILKEAQRDYKGRATVVSLDVMKYPELATKAGVRVIPTLIFYDAQGRESTRHVGFMDKAALRALLDRLLAR